MAKFFLSPSPLWRFVMVKLAGFYSFYFVPNSHFVAGSTLMVSLSFSIVCSVLKVISVSLRQSVSCEKTD